MVKGNNSSNTTKTKQETYAEKCSKAQKTWLDNNFRIDSRGDDKTIQYVRTEDRWKNFVQTWYYSVPIVLYCLWRLYDIQNNSDILVYLTPQERAEAMIPYEVVILATLVIHYLVSANKIEVVVSEDTKCPKKYHLQK